MVDFYLRNRAHLSPGAQAGGGFYPRPTVEPLARRLQPLFRGSAVQLVALDPRGGCFPPAISRNIVMGMFRACHLGYASTKEHEGRA